ncbi:MAG: hypothetical protein IPM98_06130 [Lewinellaceae bacterium]|nr:hypothetical protein [Lewinellaceae bacterium]
MEQNRWCCRRFQAPVPVLTSLVCNSPFSPIVEQQLNGLTAGQTYYLRVFTLNNLVFSDFNICIGTPPPAPSNDECAGAITLTVNANLNCGAVLSTSTSGGTPSNVSTSGCSGSADDDVWFKFVATHTSHWVYVEGEGEDMTVQTLTGACNALSAVVCSSPFSSSVVQQLSGLTIGQTYHVRVFTRSNLVYEDFSICIGTPSTAPANDLCANAIALIVNAGSTCSDTLNATTSGATASNPAISGCSGTADDDVWFKFVATGTTHLIKITNATRGMAVQAFSGVCGTLVSLGCNNDHPFVGSVELPVSGLTVGQTYFVRVYTPLNQAFSNFTVCVGPAPAPPANDLCANATTLAVNPDLSCGISLVATTVGATASNPVVGGCSSSADDDVWYKFVATGPSHRVKITGALHRMVLQVFSGTCGSFVTLACNDPFSPNIEQQINNLTAGTTYYLRVYTRENLSYGSFSICIGTPPPAPANDTCANAITLAVNPDLSCGAVLQTTTSGGTPSNPAVSGCSSSPDDDVWYKFVATGPSHRIKINGTVHRMVMQVFSGVCGSLVSIECNDPFSPNIEQQLNGLTAGATYFIRVYTREDLVYDDFTICIGTPPPPPANDICTNATTLAVNPDLNCGAVLETTTSGGLPSNPAVGGCSSSSDDDVWYKFVATGPSHRIKITGTVHRMVMQVFSGVCGSLVSLDCNDPFSPNIEQQLNGLTAGATYLIRVYTREYLVYDDFTICIGTPPAAPANDTCANATMLVVNPDLECAVVLNTTTTGGTPSNPAISGCSSSADDDVWYKFVATAPSHRVKITGVTERMVLQVFSGACGGFTTLLCNDPFSQNIEQQVNGLTPGSTYYIRVYTREYLVYSNFTICITTVVPPPANDVCSSAISLTVNPDLSCANTLTATTNGGLPSNPAISGCFGTADDDVWFSFVATGPSHRVRLSGVAKPMVLQSFSGVCGALTTLACTTTYPSTGTVEHQINGLAAGATYYVRAYTYLNLVSSTFTICIGTPPPPPANDECANAYALVVNPNQNCVDTLNATTAGALQSLPACSGAAADDDVWFKFTALADSQTVSVTNGTEPLVLQIFSGDCNGLTSLFCDYSFNGSPSRKLTGLTPGNTYYLRVYTADNLDYSDFTICVTVPVAPGPPVDTLCKIIAFQAPDDGVFPTDCGVSWQEDGVPMQVENACGGGNSCSFDFNTVGSGLFLAPGTLQLTIAPECGNRVTRIEIDIVDYCGIGCTSAEYLDGMAVIGVDSNTVLTQLETFVFQVPANSNLTQVNICSFEGVIEEVRIYCLKEVTVGAKVLLQGPYISGVQLMHDSLRVQNRIPLTEPYTGLTGFIHKGCGGGEQTRASVLAVTGANAIVDWVFLELRDADTPALVVATRAALVQRDGDVVDVDGVSSVGFGHDLDTGSYYLAIRHRNHLGVQLGAPKFYERGAAVQTNFTTLPPEGFYSYNGLSAAQRLISGRYTLWAGNGRIDPQLKYNGSNNDRNAILSVVGLLTPNAVVTGYRLQDYNMDGQVKYNGSANDRNVLLGNVGILTPSAIVEEQVAR